MKKDVFDFNLTEEDMSAIGEKETARQQQGKEKLVNG